jgi:transcriptional regulator with XRE-family HTH domain
MSTNVASEEQQVDPASKEVGARLAAERQRIGLNQAQLGDLCGVSKTSQVNYESGKRSPDVTYMAAAMRSGVDVIYVITGTRQTTAASQDEFVSIPLLNVVASAGNGTVNEPEAAYEVQGLAFSRTWLDRRKLNPQHLKVIEVKGSSMNGVLSDGDRVLIDLSDTKPRSGFVYVLRQGDELLVKFCQLLPGGVLRVSSANTQFAPYDVVLDESSDVQIVGRVVASMHEW